MTDKKGLYVHIPFCIKKCGYCDFLSAPASPEKRSAYVECLRREIRAFRTYGYQADTVFFGGGTPSLLSAAEFSAVMEELYQAFWIEEGAEITVECNPETVDEEKLAAMKHMGVNRVSLGLQSASDKELALLGRVHSYQRFLKAYELVLNAGFVNVNVDLMSAIPSQTEESWEATLTKVCALRPQHISAYSLIIEEGTPFFDRQAELLLPDEDAERRMYHRTKELLARAGYMRYEISNYALPGFACRHNRKYWTGEDYIGFGLGASSLLDGVRYHNPVEMEKYSLWCGSPEKLRCEEERLSTKHKMEEFCFLGLRLTEGIERNEFLLRFGRPIEEVYGTAIEKLEGLGLLCQKKDRIALTEKGIDVSNQVFVEFLL